MELKELAALQKRTNLMRADEVASVLGVSRKLLSQLPIPFIRLSPAALRWKASDVADYALRMARMMDLSEIAGMAQPVFNESCIYFLLKDREIVYVGQTTRFFTRIGKHVESKDFDSVTYLPCPAEDLHGREAHYIEKFRPKYNTLWKRND